jgi:predicted nucleotidyltransferase
MTETLAAVAARTDATIASARAELVSAVRAAHASGMTQQQIARAIGRSQPEVSRLLHFHGTTPLGRTLRANSHHVEQILKAAGGVDIRVFGSVATGTDREDSDIDLLIAMHQPISLLELSAVERELTALLGTKVDVVPDTTLRPDIRERVLSEAIPL